MKHVFRTLPACLFLLVVFSVSAADAIDDKDVASLLNLLPPDAVSNVEVFQANGFQVSSSRNREFNADLTPSGFQFDALTVKADGTFKVLIEKGRPMSTGGGIALFHRESGEPMLGAGDRNGDGHLDIVSYSVFDENGEHVLDVIDYEADGQADLRVHFSEKGLEIWHNERWYRSENRGGLRGIVVDGTFREIRNIDNRLVIK